MKRSYVSIVALVCLFLGGALSQLSSRRAEAQLGQAGRYQLFQGRYVVNSRGSGGAEVNGVFRIDTTTGKADGYYAGTNKEGKYVEGWAPIP